MSSEFTRKMQKNKEVTFCLLGATFATQNMGVSALTEGAIRCILHRFPRASIFLLDYGRTTTVYRLKVNEREIAIPLVNMRFSKRFHLPNNIAVLLVIAFVVRLIPFQRLREKLIASHPCLRHVQRADIVAAISGGDSFSDIYGLGRLLYVSLPQILALLCGKRLVLLPQTIGPFQKRSAKAVARYIVSRAELVYSRDLGGLEAAQELLSQNAKPDKVQLCYDVGFVVEATIPRREEVECLPERRKNGPLVGVNPSGLLYLGGYTRDNMFRLCTDYKELVIALIDFLIVKQGATVSLIPHVFGGEGHLESDSVVCKKIYEAVRAKYGDKIGWVRGSYNQGEIKHIIGKCDFFIGSRMHACIAALSQNIPAVAIAYSDKFIGVMESVGVPSLVADARAMSVAEILAVVEQAYDHRDSLREQLARRMPHIRKMVLGLLHDFDPMVHDGTVPKTRISSLRSNPGQARDLNLD